MAIQINTRIYAVGLLQNKTWIGTLISTYKALTFTERKKPSMSLSTGDANIGDWRRKLPNTGENTGECMPSFFKS